MQPTVLAERYASDGFVAPVDVLSEADAARHRRHLERAEERLGPLHYREKVHTLLTSPFELATHPVLLDAVEAILGPDILLYNVTYIVKEPRSPAHVAWHQDLTYWGLSSDAQVSAWLALSPATDRSGCMMMIPGSHRLGPIRHDNRADDTNVLANGQLVEGVDESAAVLCPLQPGQASLHHGWTLHASRPNHSDDRRIGVNIQFLSPSVRQTLRDRDTALLVRGTDRHMHFARDETPGAELDPESIARWQQRAQAMKDTYAAAVGDPRTRGNPTDVTAR